MARLCDAACIVGPCLCTLVFGGFLVPGVGGQRGRGQDPECHVRAFLLSGRRFIPSAIHSHAVSGIGAPGRILPLHYDAHITQFGGLGDRLMKEHNMVLSVDILPEEWLSRLMRLLS